MYGTTNTATGQKNLVRSIYDGIDFKAGNIGFNDMYRSGWSSI